MKGNTMIAQVVEPYAGALMTLAQETNKVEAFAENCWALLSLFQESAEFRSFVMNPLVKAEDKKGVLQGVCGQDVDAYFLNFLFLLVDRRRIVFLEGICQEFVALQRKLNNIVLADVTSAQPLTTDQEAAIADQVKQMTGANAVELNISTDADLIGGVVIKVGSKVFDASLRGQLRRISMDLLGSN
ncbi:ATP synthase F1 subunit delta [Picosynechococcus sp. PCC 73109]|uniref:ATP synthase F1 subunit delta n=1 Tax=Picosynechococcus sp. PCC 73109 TaxID=374982 RepID=UPI0007457FE8|nr:ATP synthase F1 subunit delta [Picosynechococcus sp. PCC 73109]AMA08515.1 ATP synthase F0F1 subunit delta [Picosynechococcus sp. PCC 73109]